LKGLLCLQSNLIDEAQKTADQLDALNRIGSNKNRVRSSYLLKGAMENKKGNYSSAIALISDAIALLPYENEFTNNHARYFRNLADAYQKSGDLEKAKEMYEKIALLTISRVQNGDVYVKSFYMLGKIYEEQGNTAKAIENYEKFLDLWKDADPGIAEVEDAKTKIAGLKN
jgi:tetratricopeptide (TPR) repeat protein